MADFEILVQAGSNHLVIIFLVKLLQGFVTVQQPTACQQYRDGKTQDDNMACILHSESDFLPDLFDGLSKQGEKFCDYFCQFLNFFR